MGKEEPQPCSLPSQPLILCPIHCRLSLEGERRRSQATLQDTPRTLRGLSAGEGQPFLRRLPRGPRLGDDGGSVPCVSLCWAHTAPAARCLLHHGLGITSCMEVSQLEPLQPRPGSFPGRQHRTGHGWGTAPSPISLPSPPSDIYPDFFFPPPGFILFFPDVDNERSEWLPPLLALLSGFALSATNLFVSRIISYEPAACPALFHPSSWGMDGQKDFSRCPQP